MSAKRAARRSGRTSCRERLGDRGVHPVVSKVSPPFLRSLVVVALIKAACNAGALDPADWWPALHLPDVIILDDGGEAA